MKWGLLGYPSLFWIRDVFWLGPPVPKVLGANSISNPSQIQIVAILRKKVGAMFSSKSRQSGFDTHWGSTKTHWGRTKTHWGRTKTHWGSTKTLACWL